MEAVRHVSWLKVLLYRLRCRGSTLTPANDSIGLAPPTIGGRTSGSCVTCTAGDNLHLHA